MHSLTVSSAAATDKLLSLPWLALHEILNETLVILRWSLTGLYDLQMNVDGLDEAPLLETWNPPELFAIDANNERFDGSNGVLLFLTPLLSRRCRWRRASINGVAVFVSVVISIREFCCLHEIFKGPHASRGHWICALGAASERLSPVCQNGELLQRPRKQSKLVKRHRTASPSSEENGTLLAAPLPISVS